MAFMHAARRARQWLREAPYRVRVATASLAGIPAGDNVRVSYGFARMRDRLETLHGGLVKVQRLRERFPNHAWRFNVAYLVSSQMPPAASTFLRLARSGRVPLVWNQNGVAYPAWHGPGYERVNGDMAVMLRTAAYVVYQSRFCKLSADRFLGPSAGPWEILYNAVDTAYFTPRRRESGRPLTILVGGTQDVAYRVCVALAVLARVARRRPDARMIVTGELRWGAGRAAAMSEMQRLVKALGVGDRVSFTGPYAQVDAPAVYAQADLLLHCKYNDPSPGMVVEALACGLPVVYSASGGMPELVGDAGIGLPCELSWEREIWPDADAMAEAVLAVAARRGELSEAARQRAVERFDLAPWLDRHAAIFEEVLARRA